MSDPISLDDRTPVTEVTVAKSTSTTLADLGITVATLDSVSSPFDDPAPMTTIANSAPLSGIGGLPGGGPGTGTGR